MKPILFSGPMVKAILEGRKTQTRRVLRKQPPAHWVYKGDDGGNPYLPRESGHYWMDGYACWRPKLCPYGQVGDRLWVRETFRVNVAVVGPTLVDVAPCIQYVADWHVDTTKRWPEDKPYNNWRQPKVPSIHMPRNLSRITLEITGVKVERIQDISQGDSYAELGKSILAPTRALGGILGEFRDLWDSINAKRGYGWDVNPWDWALAFKVV